MLGAQPTPSQCRSLGFLLFSFPSSSTLHITTRWIKYSFWNIIFILCSRTCHGSLLPVQTLVPLTTIVSQQFLCKSHTRPYYSHLFPSFNNCFWKTDLLCAGSDPAPPRCGCICSPVSILPNPLWLEAETSLSSENSAGERGKKKLSNKIFSSKCNLDRKNVSYPMT